MTLRWTRQLGAALLLITIAFLPADDVAAAKKKRARRARRRAAPAAPAELATGNTLAERISSLINGPTARASDTSIEVVEVESGNVVGERNSHDPLAPASNMKLFTTAAAVDLLGPTFEVTTTVYVRGNVDTGGTLDGDVKIVGHGDQTIGGRFHDGRATAVIDDWATDL